eukprot:CAMPEP_0173380806 /NCGR_PEP_ID=MMETSP1356-20130122/3412_1 /TAXON_ID=77927 ORGANISM="Hemiselmis virescens, Strain PCC157" /NCGR_SAMPLE_ID=MMETSP1356 /ASSEMBLY_ACC=CAM_ASM_000847 /LENGTH=159 /DNA_ID=CAMNT_0014334513 /DNA_START=163 /DNA_END=638 /DNA_ORIENTATION=-
MAMTQDGSMTQAGEPVPPRNHKQFPVELIMPRNKAGEVGAKVPVAITLPLLCQHFHESLAVASSKMGISTTALKRVCRKLGVRRWPFTPDRSGGARKRTEGDNDASEEDTSATLGAPSFAPSLASSSFGAAGTPLQQPSATPPHDVGAAPPTAKPAAGG